MMNEEQKLETIREKLAKLKRVMECEGAAAGERESAAARYAEILERYGLTEESLVSDAKMPCRLEFDKARWGRPLMIQCVGWLLQISTVSMLERGKTHILIMLTPMDAAEARACYAYYEGIMLGKLSVINKREKRLKGLAKAQIKEIEKELKGKLKDTKADKAGLLDALVMRYELGVATPRGKMSDAELKEWARNYALGQQLKGDAWQRAKKVASGQTDLNLEFN